VDDRIRALANALVSRVREPLPDSRQEDDYGIEAALNAYSLSFRLYERASVLMPCWHDANGALPVDPLILGRGLPSEPTEVRDFQRSVAGLLQSLAERSRMGYTEASTSEIYDSLIERTTAHLAVAASSPPGRPSGTLAFTVQTLGSGLAVHCHLALLVNNLTYFNAPTTPVSGWLKPGYWKFAATGPGMPMTWDPGVFDAALGQATLTAV